VKNNPSREKYRFVLISALIFLFSTASSQGLRINEAVSVNPGYLTDADGDSPDWFEVINPELSAVNLAGWSVTDDRKEPGKWIVAQGLLQPSGRMVVFASGKNRTPEVSGWNTVIANQNPCKYTIGSASLSPSWRFRQFSETGWLDGKVSVGFGDNDDATVISPAGSVFIRIHFSVEDTALIQSGFLFADYDDGFVAWLNGAEIVRANMAGVKDTPPAWNAYAASIHEAAMYSGGKPDKFQLSRFKHLLVPGDNVLAVQVHNSDAASSDLTFIPFLVFGMKSGGNTGKPLPAVCEVPRQEYHTNFSLSSSGETLYLIHPDGTAADSVTLPAMTSGLSWARIPDGSDSWQLTQVPTPGQPNPSTGFPGAAPPVQLTVTGGAYTSPFQVPKPLPVSGETIRYTLNGMEPTASSPAFSSAVLISKTSVLKTRSFKSGFLPGPVTTETFLISSPHKIPVVSISVDSLWFFQPDTGIYVMGPNASGSFPYFGANFWLDKEVPVYWELFDETGKKQTQFGSGLKIFGAYSRGQAQRSFALFARPEYGSKEFDYPLFPGNPVSSFQSVVLRNSGNDWAYSGIRDYLTCRLTENLGVDRLQSRPVSVYLNGRYWGVYFLMEKTSEHLLANRHGFRPESMEMVELGSGWGEFHAFNGTVDAWNSFFDWLAGKDMNSPEIQAIIRARMDVENFFLYQAVNIWILNTDWPGNNYKFWRSVNPVTPWKWIMYDTDFGYGLFNSNAYSVNGIEFASTESGDPVWPNPPISTYLFRRLLEGENFRNQFINISMDLMNSRLKSQTTQAILKEIKNEVSADMVHQRTRWAADMQGNWSDQVSSIGNFLYNRNQYMLLHLFQMIKKGGTGIVNLTGDPEKGSIRLNSLTLTQPTFQGPYFSEVPVTISAVPKPGYRFKGWTGTLSDTSRTLNLKPPTTGLYLTAVFEPVFSQEAQISINEINYNSKPGSGTGDWVELVNSGDAQADLSGWVFKDEDNAHSYLIPGGTVLQPGGFLVLAERPDTLLKRFPGKNILPVALPFGFSGSGEVLRLFKPDGSAADTVHYLDSDPWPSEADGTGKTLEKINPGKLSSDPVNWKPGPDGGTPGSTNSVFVSVNQPAKNQQPTVLTLAGNFPNPFNPETTLQFYLPGPGVVSVEIYEVTGRRVSAFQRSYQEAGLKELPWKPENLASGILFYRLSWKNQSQTGKMLLLK